MRFAMGWRVPDAARAAAPGTRHRNSSKLHLWRLLEHLALLGPHVEEFLRRESERAGQQHGRELLDAGIVFLHRVVEETARRGDLVLDVGELSLQLLEVLAGDRKSVV